VERVVPNALKPLSTENRRRSQTAR
jgi:hypothetical protein